MNAKELIAAAKSLSHEAARYFEEYMIEDHDDPDTRGLFERIDLVTDHILATVRADDDEPLTDADFVNESLGNGYQFGRIPGNVPCIQAEGCGPVFLPHVKTRGEFRQLCRLLGVELKECE